jgi:hypothetical protein
VGRSQCPLTHPNDDRQRREPARTDRGLVAAAERDGHLSRRHEDESEHEYDVTSLSMRGAQREITGWLIRNGYAPVARWTAEAADGGDVVESSRKFRLAASS